MKKKCLRCNQKERVIGDYCEDCRPYAKRAIKITKMAEGKTMEEFFKLCENIKIKL